MRLCVVGKYPPIEGGVSMHTYWMAYGLAERGHQVDVVTNAGEVEAPFRMQLGEEDERWYEPAFAAGGRVTVWNPEPLSRRRMAHIPEANPFVTKLASTATQVIRHHDCELILAYYLEPYGMAAHLASRWTGRPAVVKHAGSDLERLMQVPDLATAYQEVLKDAAAVLTGEPLMRRFIGMGVAADRLHEPPAFALRTDVFHPGAAPLDVEGVLARADAALPHSSPGRAFDSSRPTIGVYGKLGVAKGTFDLVAALGLLKREGLRFNLLAMTHGWHEEDFRAALADAGLDDDTWRLPFLPSWRVPGFIRACTAVCFLERGFPIAIHGPTIPREVLACGTCLVVSGEIADKNRHPTPLRHLHDALVVGDPRDHGELAACLRLVVERPDTAAEIGRRGHQRSQATEDVDSFIGGFEQLLGRLSTRPPAGSMPGTPSARAAAGPSDVVRRLLPTATALLGPQLETAMSRFRDTVDDGHRDDLRTAWRFCAFLADDLPNLSLDQPSLAKTVVAYERGRLWALMDDPADTVPAFASPDCLAGRPVASADVVDTLKPLRSNHLLVETFEHDVEAFLRYGTVDRNPTVVCFHRSPNRGRTALKISRATRGLLQLCDGTRTPRQIASVVTGAGGTPTPEDGAGDGVSFVASGLQRLYDAGLVVFVSRLPPTRP